MSNTVADKLAKKTRKKAPAKQVRLKLVYIDFWSSVKFSFLVSLCAAIVGVVSMVLIYTVLLSTGGSCQAQRTCHGYCRRPGQPARALQLWNRLHLRGCGWRI